MKCKKVTAFIRAEMLETVERALQKIHAPGLSVSEVRGFGEYADLNSASWLVNHLRLELYVPEEQSEEIVKIILKQAYTGMEGDGIVAIEDVEVLLHIRSEHKDDDRD